MSIEESSPSTLHGSTDFTVGSTVFNRYKIIEFISSGAIGRVYKALDLELDIVVALKVLISETHTDRELIRFQSEARLASRLKHQNIATIYDFGLSGTTPYLSMEYVDGESLQSILKNSGRLPLDPALQVLIQVCRALVHAHSHDVVHRDIKPANVVVRYNKDLSLTAKVLDFGVAKRIDVDLSTTEGKVTPPGDLVGSPAYMSPEQSMGSNITAKSDNYSFGCLIWSCFVCEPPILGDTFLETISLVRNQVPPSLKVVCPEAPEAIVDIADRSLSKDPSLRPDLETDVLPLLEALYDDLHKPGDNQSQEESSSKLPSQIFKTIRKSNRATYARFGVGAVSLALLSYFVFSSELEKSGDVKNDRLPLSSESISPSMNPKEVREGFNAARTNRDSRISRLQIKLLEDQAKLDYASKIRDLKHILRLTSADDSTCVLDTHIELAHSYNVTGDYENAMMEYRKVIKMAEGMGVPQRKLDALDQMNHIKLVQYQKPNSNIKLSEILSSFDQADKFARTVLKPGSYECANRTLFVAEMYKYSGQFSGAEKRYRNVKSIYTNLGISPAKPEYMSLAQCYVQHADCLSLEHKFGQAIKEFKFGLQAYNNAKLVPPHQYPSVLKGYSDYCTALIALGKPDVALKVNSEAFRFFKGKQVAAPFFDFLHRDRARIEKAVRQVRN